MYQIQSTIDQQKYTELINTIKLLNSEKKSLISSQEYKLGSSVLQKIKQIENMQLKQILNSIRANITTRRSRKHITVFPKDRADLPSNYFSEKKIAVYTCITGKYDEPMDPLIFPDNCDYYIVTDRPEENRSCWKAIDIQSLGESVGALSNAEQNRFVKMHPDIVFPEYEYSVYVDGSIRICTDLTECVNRISNHGMAFYAHDLRDCVYDEINACLLVGKITENEFIEHTNYLKSSDMPAHYGLPACGIIARKHNDAICKKIMGEWWEEYLSHAKRDQLNLPLVLHNNHISVCEVTTLGNNMYADPAYEFFKHTKQ